MSDYIYSPSRNLFYDVSLEESYKRNDNWPEDSVSIGESMFMTFSATPPAGLIRVCGDDGFPAWGQVPPVPDEELVQIANNQRDQFMSLANEIILPLQDAVDLDIATESEMEKLQHWKRYRVMLNRVDTSLAPEILWPQQPEK